MVVITCVIRSTMLHAANAEWPSKSQQTAVARESHRQFSDAWSYMSPFCFGSFERANHSQLRSRYASLINAPGPLLLQTPEEIHICKLLHLIDIRGLCYLLVVEKYPGSALLVRQLLADKCNVVSSVDRTALVADNGLQFELRWELVASWLRFCL